MLYVCGRNTTRGWPVSVNRILSYNTVHLNEGIVSASRYCMKVYSSSRYCMVGIYYVSSYSMKVLCIKVLYCMKILLCQGIA